MKRGAEIPSTFVSSLANAVRSIVSIEAAAQNENENQTAAFWSKVPTPLQALGFFFLCRLHARVIGR